MAIVWPKKFRSPGKTGKPRASAFKHRVPVGRGFVMLTDEGLESYKLTCWLQRHKIMAVHIPNEGKRDRRLGAMLKLMGLEAGAADHLIFKSPPIYPSIKGVCIEMKSLTGKPTDDQLLWIRRIEAEGWMGYVTQGASVAIKTLQGLGYGE